MLNTLHNYHRKKKIHHSILVTAVVISLLSLAGILFMALQIGGAKEIPFTLTINSPAAIISQPPQTLSGGGGPIFPLAYLNPVNDELPVADTEIPTIKPINISIALKLLNDAIPLGGRASNTEPQLLIPQIKEEHPVITGSVSIPQALVFLELHHDNNAILTSSITADENGEWQWQPIVGSTAGIHTLHVTVFDPLGEITFGHAFIQYNLLSAVTALIQQLEPNQPLAAVQARTSVEIPLSVLEQRLVLFDIRAEIIGTQAPHSIQPGDVILLQVSLLNIGSPGYLVDASVAYTLYDEDGAIIMQEEETVAVATQTSFIKQFRTQPTVADGTYRIEARVSYHDTAAMAFDTFTINGDPIIAFNNTRLDISLLIQTLLIIFAISIIIAYLEFRQVELLRKIIHQVTFDDFKKEHLIR